MDARIKTGRRFLIICCLLLFGLVNGQARQKPRGALYVLPHAGNCTQTVLSLELDGISPLPTEVLLRIKWLGDRSREGKEVVSQRLSLTESGYTWSGLLTPLGKYKAQLCDAGNNAMILGEFAFNNIDILKEFITQERGEITYISRGGSDSGTTNPNVDQERKPLRVDHLPKPNGNQIHIIVMTRRGEKADEYYGSPMPEQYWISKPLFPGEYRFIVAEYYGNGNCQVIRGR